MATHTLDLNTGAKIPVVGLGTWQAPKGEVGAAVKAAVKVGYRHFDCAEIYGNEAEIGEGLKAALDEGLVKREDLFVTSKVFNHHHDPERAVQACRNTLKNLQLSYLDLYLVHWPIKFDNEDDEVKPPLRSADGRLLPQFKPSIDYKETWRALYVAVVHFFVLDSPRATPTNGRIHTPTERVCRRRVWSSRSA